MSQTGDETTGPAPAAAGARAGKVVIAGGSGLIGTHLSASLAAAGHNVVVLTRDPGRWSASRRPPSATAPHGAIRAVGWSPRTPGPWCEELADAAAVINLCGAGIGDRRWTEARKRELIDSRVVPSRALVAACRERSEPPTLLQASGVGYYGTGERPVDEDCDPGSDFLARLAVAWEAPLDDAPGRTVALRFGVVLDADGGALPRMLLPFRLFTGGPIAGGRQWLSWIHRDDAIAAIRFVLDSPLVGPINVTAPQPVRNAEFAAVAGAVLRRPALLPLPGFVLQGLLGEQATLVCDGQRALPARLEAAGFAFRFPDLRHALTDLTR
jgi:uncharacterized protein